MSGRSICATIADQTSPSDALLRYRGLAADPHHGAHTLVDWWAVPPEKDHRGRPVAGYVGAGGVNHMGQIPARDELLDQLPAELALHEGIGRDHSHEAPRFRLVGHRGLRCVGEVEEALGERDGE